MSAFVSLLPPAFLDPIKSVLNGVISQGNATLIALHASDHPAALAAVSGPSPSPYPFHPS